MAKLFKFSVVVLFVILLVLIILKINFNELHFFLGEMNFFYFSLAILSCFLGFFIWNIRSKYFFRNLFKGSFGFLFSVLFSSAFFSAISPGAGIGGDPFKAYFLSKKYHKSKNQVLAYVLSDKFFHLSIQVIFILFSILFVLVFVKVSNNLTIILEIMLLLILLLFSLLFLGLLNKSPFKYESFFEKLYWFGFIKKHFKNKKDFKKYCNLKLREFGGIFRNSVKDKNNILVGLFFSIFFWLLHYALFYFLFLSFNFHISFLVVIIVVTLGDLAGTISFFPGGAGISEETMILLYSIMGVNFSLGLLVVFFNRLIYYFFAIFIGGLNLIYLRNNIKHEKN